MNTIYTYIQCCGAGWQHCENDNTLVMAKGELEQAQLLCLGNCAAIWRSQRSLIEWICVMASRGLKANSKKIEGRLLESHPISYLSSPSPTPPSLTVWSAAARAPRREGGQFHYPEKLNRKPNRAVCAVSGL